MSSVKQTAWQPGFSTRILYLCSSTSDHGLVADNCLGGSWILKALYSPPEDALACCLHAAATYELVPGGYYARGLFASPLIAEQNSMAATGVLSLADWPLRWMSSGSLCSGRVIANDKLLKHDGHVDWYWAPGLIFAFSDLQVSAVFR